STRRQHPAHSPTRRSANLLAVGRRARRGSLAVGFVALTALVAGLVVAAATRPPDPALSPTPSALPSIAHGPAVCGTPILNSPASPGRYGSGKPGLPTFGTPGSDFPRATAGRVLAAGQRSFQAWQLKRNTVYYLVPGVHIGTFLANRNDAFVGGFYNGRRTI